MKTKTRKKDPSDTLLQTKLHRPRPTRHLVVRQRLWEQLDKGKAHPLILICAPAGYGKTTLASSWVEGMQAKGKRRSISMPAAWLSLDNNDSDVIIFIQYLIGSLRTIFKGACSKTFNLVRSPQQPPLTAITTSLINEIGHLPGSFILVLDDYQSIQGQAVHDLLEKLLQHSSSFLHLVLISRTDPPLSVARLRANGLLTEIRSRDLRFIKEEATTYLSANLDFTLNDSALTQLEERMEGWIAGLRLATLSLRTSSDANTALTTLTGTDTNLTDYLADEVLSRQLPAIQNFLLKTSILDRFSVSLCEAVIGESDPAWSVATCIDWLERMELFITPLDNQKQWYRYHQLFQELLRQRLKAGAGQETEKVLYHRASAWFAMQGMLDEAIKYARESGDFQQTARLMELGLRDVLNREDRLTLEQWLRLLPEEVIHSRPLLLMVKVWALVLSWQLGAAIKALHQVEAIIEADEATLDADTLQILRGQIAVVHAQDAYFSNQPAQALDYCRKGLTLLPQSWTYARGGLMLYLGMSMQATGHSQAAERMLFDQYESIDDKTDVFALRLLLSLCFNNLTNGSLENSRQVAHIMLQQATRRSLEISKNWGHYFIGLVKYQWNELDAAEEHLTEIVESRYNITALTAQHAMTVLVRIHQARGRNSAAWQIMETLSQFDLERIGFEADETSSLRARLNLLQGKMDDAFRWADSFTSPPPGQPLLWLENSHATRAQILIARGEKVDLKLALKILDTLKEMAARTYNTRFLIEVLALRALALDALDRAGDAEAELVQALELAQSGGFIRVFIDLGLPMQAILNRLDGRSPNSDYINRLLAAFTVEQRKKSGDINQVTAAPGTALNQPVLAEPLTSREMDVLNLLLEPLSNKEIAGRLYLSPATVKRHTINLYGKLGVHSRREAIAEAIELGIISPT